MAKLIIGSVLLFVLITSVFDLELAKIEDEENKKFRVTKFSTGLLNIYLKKIGDFHILTFSNDFTLSLFGICNICKFCITPTQFYFNVGNPECTKKGCEEKAMALERDIVEALPNSRFYINGVYFYLMTNEGHILAVKNLG